MKPENIAIIGTGIAGLTCGYYLSRNHRVTLFEAADYIGGHTHTVEVEKEGERSLIDTGFIVFNDRTYPNFIRLMEEIGVAGQATEMSFSVRNDQLGLEYNGGTIAGLFAQRKNAVSPRFLGMLYEIARFNKEVRRAAADGSHRTLGGFLSRSRYSSMFRENYLLPMVSAIWSMGLDDCHDFPLSLFVRFFDNHGLLDLTNRPQWRTIAGGSSGYIEPSGSAN
jgi:predicted NAD/FAD-binding protein